MAVMTSLVGRSEGQAPAMGFQQWLQQGEALYQNALKEFHHIESQLEELDARLAAKLTELNQIASILGKAPIESTRRLSAQLVAAPANGVPAALEEPVERAQPTSSNANNIARALTGRFGR